MIISATITQSHRKKKNIYSIVSGFYLLFLFVLVSKRCQPDVARWSVAAGKRVPFPVIITAQL